MAGGLCGTDHGLCGTVHGLCGTDGRHGGALPSRGDTIGDVVENWLYTLWMDWTPSREQTRRELKRAGMCLVVCIPLLFILLPSRSAWVMLPMLIDVAALLFLGFGLNRLRLGRSLRCRWRFNDRLIEREWLAENCTPPFPIVIAYDALARVVILKGTIGFCIRGQQFPEEILGFQFFRDRETLVALLVRIAAHDVPIVHEDDTLETAQFGSLPTDAS